MNKRKEKISAFLDNDLHRDELMSFSLSSEADDAETAQRYQMVGEVLRGELSEAAFVDVSAAVHKTLMDENIAHDMPTVKAAVSSEKSGRFDLSAWFRPATGMAVAVLVAVVMVASLSPQDEGNVAPLATNTENQPKLMPTPIPESMLAVDKENKEINPYVNQHLVNQHLEYATQDALQGRLPYVRAVSYETKK